MFHSSFDSVAQFLHRKTEAAKAQTMVIMGPARGRIVFGLISFAVLAGFLFLALLVVDTIFGFGLLGGLFDGLKP